MRSMSWLRPQCSESAPARVGRELVDANSPMANEHPAALAGASVQWTRAQRGTSRHGLAQRGTAIRGGCRAKTCNRGVRGLVRRLLVGAGDVVADVGGCGMAAHLGGPYLFWIVIWCRSCICR